MARNGSPDRARHRREARCSSPPTWPRWSATPGRSSTWTTARSPRSRADGFHTSTLDAPAAPTRRRLDRRRRRRATTSSAATTHYMRKEIHEQPEAVAPRAARPPRRALRHRAPRRHRTWTPATLRTIRRVKFLGCGSAYYAGQMGAQLDRGAGPDPRRRRAGVGVPLPQPGGRPGHAVRRGQPVRARRSTRWPPCRSSSARAAA